MGARTDAARAEVVARRQVLLHEVTRLEASGRAAVDVKAKVKNNPAKTAALAAGTAFLVLGGPKRTYKAVRKAIFGPDAELPKSMLPEEIDKVLHSMGTDGNRVRGVIEREFVDYLEKNKQVREQRELRATAVEIGGSLLRPVASQAGKRLAEELFKPDGDSFKDVMGRIQNRREERKSDKAASGDPGEHRGRRFGRKGH